jgi:hypothetical protein
MIRITLLLLWATVLSSFSSSAQTPGQIEACEYDPTVNRWFVSNGNSLLETFDQGGSWSYFGDAEATHGMEVLGNVLYAIDGGTLRAYDLTSAEELGSLSLGLGFANGMGNDGAHTLVISDFSTGKILKVDVSDPADMTKEVLVNNIGDTPNGVVIDATAGRAVVVCWGSNADILAVDMTSGEVTTLVDGTGLGYLDGIDMDGSGRYYVSSWSPARITRYSADFTESETLVTASAGGLLDPADISYAIALDTLGVANSGNSAVTFHGFETDKVSALNPQQQPLFSADAAGMNCGLTTAGRWQLSAYSLNGKLLGEQSMDFLPGSTRVLWERLGAGFKQAAIVRVNNHTGTFVVTLRK